MNDEILQDFKKLLTENTIALQLLSKLLKDHLITPDATSCNSFPVVDQKLENSYDPDQLITVDRACRLLRISRSTLDRLRKSGQLTSVYQGRLVRLIREEVMEAKNWYSIPRGKV